MVMSWVIWCLALAGSAALYLFAPNGWVLALGAMVLLLPFLSFPGVWLVRRHLYASLELPETMEKKREAGLNVKLRNDCRFSAPCVQLVLRLENRLTGERSVRKLTFSVAANSTVSETIPFLPEYCGALSAELEKLCVRDVFRFWSAFRICGERQESRRENRRDELVRLGQEGVCGQHILEEGAGVAFDDLIVLNAADLHDLFHQTDRSDHRASADETDDG